MLEPSRSTPHSAMPGATTPWNAVAFRIVGALRLTTEKADTIHRTELARLSDVTMLCKTAYSSPPAASASRETLSTCRLWRARARGLVCRQKRHVMVTRLVDCAHLSKGATGPTRNPRGAGQSGQALKRATVAEHCLAGVGEARLASHLRNKHRQQNRQRDIDEKEHLLHLYHVLVRRRFHHHRVRLRLEERRRCALRFYRGEHSAGDEK